MGASTLKEESQIKAALPFATAQELGGASNLIDALFRVSIFIDVKTAMSFCLKVAIDTGYQIFYK